MNYSKTDPLRGERILQALKNGVAPPNATGWPCCGRQPQQQELLKSLGQAGRGLGIMRFLSGEYGSGKSLLMASLEHQALEENFVVARFQLEPGSLINNFSLLYARIMHSLSVRVSGKNLPADFESIFGNWLSHLNGLEPGEAAGEIRRVTGELHEINHGFARAFLGYVRGRISGDREQAWAAAAFIQGESNIPAALKARFGIRGAIERSQAMECLRAFARLLVLLGYAGLVILIDEAELIMKARSDIRRSSYENIRFLMDALAEGSFPHCLWVLVGTEEFFNNRDTGIRSHEALHQRIGSAMESGGSLLHDLRQPVIHLGHLPEEDLNRLTGNLVRLHTALHRWSPSISVPSIRNWTLLNLYRSEEPRPSANPRAYIIRLLELLDLMQQHPERQIFHTELDLVPADGRYRFIHKK